MSGPIDDATLDLAARRSLTELSEGALYNLMLRIYGTLMISTAKQSVAKGIPVIGAGIAGGDNYYSARRAMTTASYVYPERLLMDRYPDHGAARDVAGPDMSAIEAAVFDDLSDRDRRVIDRLSDENLGSDSSEEESE